MVARPKRRTFTAEYKQRILRRPMRRRHTRRHRRLAAPRRAVLFAPGHLAARAGHGILEGLTPQKRGPKSKRNPLEEENQKLRRQNQRLTEELRKAEIVIDVQKKVAALLGWPIPKADPEEKS